MIKGQHRHEAHPLLRGTGAVRNFNDDAESQMQRLAGHRFCRRRSAYQSRFVAIKKLLEELVTTRLTISDPDRPWQPAMEQSYRLEL